ncbi:MAG TPA: hypothetical protein VJ921_15265, partial [Vicinamibacteria bacterium]|nr:hypothetical protein [Vicinamibacteria bacterium]
MLEDRISRIALGVSLLLHGALVAPMWDRWVPIAADADALVGPPPPEPISFRLVDPQEGPDAKPETPTPNVSDADRRAAQPDAPEELPRGEAFSAGEIPLPSASRPAGAPTSTAAPPPS